MQGKFRAVLRLRFIKNFDLQSLERTNSSLSDEVSGTTPVPSTALPFPSVDNFMRATEICPVRRETLALGLSAMPRKSGVFYTADFSTVCA